jgi:hypothetical protein
MVPGRENSCAPLRQNCDSFHITLTAARASLYSQDCAGQGITQQNIRQYVQVSVSPTSPQKMAASHAIRFH